MYLCLSDEEVSHLSAALEYAIDSYEHTGADVATDDPEDFDGQAQLYIRATVLRNIKSRLPE